MIRVLMCGPLASSGGVSSHTKNLAKNLKKIGINLILYNLSGDKPESLNASVWRKLYQRSIGLILIAIRKRDQYDIIHIQASGGIFSYISAIIGVFVANSLKKKIIITFHYSKTEIFINSNKNIFRYTLNGSDKLLLVSFSQEKLISNLFPEFSSKLAVIPNGYKSDIFYPRDMNKCRHILSLDVNKKIILNISNLIPTKGQKYLILAVNEIVRERTDILCIIVGEGHLKSDLEELIEKLKLNKYIKLAGWRPDEEIPIWINASDIFVLPSMAEGNPTVMFEALGCGKPFIGTKIGGIPEIIDSDDYGLVSDTHDPVNLAKVIQLGLSMNWSSKKITAYSEQFEWENIAKRVSDVYREII